MTKIAIIGDIHCHQYLFELVLKDINNEVDEYIFLGDYITDGPNANEILNVIKKKSKNVILGNREVDMINYSEQKKTDVVRYRSKLFTFDEISEENIDFLKRIPLYQIIGVKNKRICFSHASPYNVKDEVLANDYQLFDKLIADFDCDVYLFGHQHRPFFLEYKKKFFINPGSVNTPLDGRATSKYGILIIDEAIKYEQKEIVYNWQMASDYYLHSNYFDECPEWSNLLIYILRDGIDYRKLFVKKILREKNNWDQLTKEEWHRFFVDFMKKYNLPIIRKEENG